MDVSRSGLTTNKVVKSKSRITRPRERRRCLQCESRRIKCDLLRPCTECVRSGVICTPPDNSHLNSQRKPVVKPRLSEKATRQADRLEEIIEQLARDGSSSSYIPGGGFKEASVSAHGGAGIDINSIDHHSYSDYTTPSEPMARSSESDSLKQRTSSTIMHKPLQAPINKYSSYTSPTSWIALSGDDSSYLEMSLSQDDCKHSSSCHDCSTSALDPNRWLLSTQRDSSTYKSLAFSDLEDQKGISQYYPPTKAHVMRLIELFIGNVDPFIRLLHKPSFIKLATQFLNVFYQNDIFQEPRDTIMKGTFDRDPELVAFPPLLFSALYAAPVSLEEADFQHLFPGSFISCRELSARYRKATELALAEVNFTESKDLNILQALTLFMSVGTRDGEAQKDWILLGVAVRIAQAMGLHRDGTTQGFSPLETELRRRIWAKLRFMDVRAAEELGCEPSIGPSSYDTLLPENIDDNKLRYESNGDAPKILDRYQPMPTPPYDPDVLGTTGISNITRNYRDESFTEMTFSLLRYEIVGLLNSQLGPNFSPHADIKEQRRQAINTVQRQLEENYKVTDWDMSDPIKRLTWRIVTTQLAKARFLVDVQPWDAAAENQKERLVEQSRAFHNATTILEQTIALREDAKMLNCQWYIRSCTQFHATALLLFQIARGGVESHAADRAWNAIDRLYGSSHSEDNGNDEEHRTYCACVPGHALDILSSPLQRLLQVAREKSNRTRKFSSKLKVDQTQREVELETIQNPSSDPLLQEPETAMNALDSDVLDEAFMDWISIDGSLTNQETPFGHSLRFSAF